MTSERRWLVVGAGGRLGRVLCSPERPWLIPTTRAQVDATIPDAVDLALQATGAYGVLNLAAAADVARCEREPEWAYTGNVLVARSVAEACARRNRVLVHVSTDYVFGSGDPELVDRRPPWAPYNVRGPVNVYGKSKAVAEDVVYNVAFHAKFLSAYIVRMSFLADPPGYAWVIGGVRVTKEWIGDAADRLARFLQRGVVNTPGFTTEHLVTERETTLDALVRERYPDTPVVPYNQGIGRLPYALPADLRLAGAWRG